MDSFSTAKWSNPFRFWAPKRYDIALERCNDRLWWFWACWGCTRFIHKNIHLRTFFWKPSHIRYFLCCFTKEVVAKWYLVTIQRQNSSWSAHRKCCNAFVCVPEPFGSRFISLTNISGRWIIFSHQTYFLCKTTKEMPNMEIQAPECLAHTRTG